MNFNQTASQILSSIHSYQIVAKNDIQEAKKIKSLLSEANVLCGKSSMNHPFLHL